MIGAARTRAAKRRRRLAEPVEEARRSALRHRGSGAVGRRADPDVRLAAMGGEHAGEGPRRRRGTRSHRCRGRRRRRTVVVPAGRGLRSRGPRRCGRCGSGHRRHRRRSEHGARGSCHRGRAAATPLTRPVASVRVPVTRHPGLHRRARLLGGVQEDVVEDVTARGDQVVDAGAVLDLLDELAAREVERHGADRRRAAVDDLARGGPSGRAGRRRPGRWRGSRGCRSAGRRGRRRGRRGPVGRAASPSRRRRSGHRRR